MELGKRINDAILNSLKKLVEDLGGVKSVSRFLGINTQNLNGYLNGSRKEIREDHWSNIIKPVLNKTRTELLDLYSTKYMRLEKKADKLDYIEYRFEREKEDIQNRIRDYIENPFNVYFSEFVDFDGSFNDSIIENIKAMRNGKKIPYDLLVRNIDEFRRLYELFRPDSIAHGHPYHGTVKVMDAIYETFSSVFNIEYDEGFSKWGNSWIMDLYKEKLEFSEINWEHLIADLESVKKSIEGAIFNLAIKSKEYFEISHSYQYRFILYGYLQKYFKIDEDKFIKINVQPGRIIINNTEYNFTRRYELFEILDQYFKRNNKKN